MRFLLIALLLGLCGNPNRAKSDDWPQWLGPQRDSQYREEGVIERIPEAGLKIKWRSPMARGYAGPAVAGGRVYVMDYVVTEGEITNNPGGADQLQGRERVLCLDSRTGAPLWMHQYERAYRFSFGGGPRTTCSVDGGLVFALGAEGNLWCLDAEDGRVVWSKDFVKDYRAATPYWGVAAHPLIAGDHLICIVGAPQGLVMAFDKRTGREVWRALSAEETGYCPPTLIEHGGRQQLVVWHGESLHGLEPRSGKAFWSVPLEPSHGMAIAAPRQLGPYLYASGFGDVAVLLKLDSRAPVVQEVWRGRPKTAVYCANSTPILEEGMIYGCDITSGALMGIRLSDGQRLWQTTTPTLGATKRGRYGTAFLVKHKNQFFLFSETGDLILARLSPSGYEELGRYHVLEPTSEVFGRSVVWSHPAFAERSCFARNDREMVCVSLAAE